MKNNNKHHYNRIYQDINTFGYNKWLYYPYVKALISFAEIHLGSKILDAPCGQGFFSYMFAKNGMSVYGIDISETAILMAKKIFCNESLTFFVSDMKYLPINYKFDCIFTRSSSIYNNINFKNDTEVTKSLLRYLKMGGSFIFAYNTNLSGTKGKNNWVNHTVEDVKEHFEIVKNLNPHIYLSLKIDTLLFGKFAFNKLISRLNQYIVKHSGYNGDVVCIFKKKLYL